MYLSLKEGTLIRRFRARDDREVSLRAPKWSDLDDMLELVNSLVEEGADIGTTEKLSRDDEVDWLAKHLSDVEKDKKVTIVAEVDGKFIGQIEVRPMSGSSRHVGFLVIAISDGYRNISIGTEMMKEAEIQSRRLGLKLITLEVFATNQRAIRL